MKYAPSYIARILFNYFSDELTPEEEDVLNDWVAESDANRRLLEELSDPVQFMRKWERHNRMDAERSWKELMKQAPELFRFDIDGRKTGSFMAVAFARVSHFFSRLFDLPRRTMLQLFLVLVIVGGLIGLYQIFRNRAPVAQTLPQTEVSAAALSLTLTGPSATLQPAGGPELKLGGLPRGAIGKTGFLKTDSLQITLSAEPPDPGHAFDFFVSTPPEELYTVVLNDSTIVKLNASSRLKIPSDYGKDKREVSLEGEAYFEVSPNKLKTPFIVHTSDTVKVVCLGTRFVVEAYKDEGRIAATLEEGSIRMEKGKDKIELDSSRSTVVVDRNGILKRDDAEEAGSSWKDRRFEFTGVPASRILRELGRWYGKKITYDDYVPNEAQDFYGSYDEPFDSTVGHLAQIVPFSYRHVANGIRVLR